jgi:hypothetical protein
VDFVNGLYQVAGVSYPLGSLPGWTFSRASVGYGQMASGLLVPFASGAPRITDLGLLVEGPATNLLLQSVDLTNAAWSTSGSVVTSPGLVAPDGTSTAQQAAVAGSAIGSYQSITTTINIGDVYTLSVWVRAASAQNINIAIQGAGQIANNKGLFVNVTTAWQRVSLSVTMGAADTGLYAVVANTSGLVSTPGTSVIGTAQTIYIWNPQLEKNPFATSDVRTTTAAATRAADWAYISGLAALTSGTLVARWTDPVTFPASLRSVAELSNVTQSLGDIAFFQANAGVTAAGLLMSGFAVSTGASQAELGTVNQSAGQHRAAFAFGASDYRISFDGGSVISQSSGLAPQALTLMGIGSRATTAQYPANGYIRSVSAYSNKFTNTQLQAIAP